MEDYVREAKSKGLSAMGFSDHLPFDETHMKEYTMDKCDLEGYIRSIPRLEKKFGIRIYTGIEADYYPGRQDEIRGLLGQYDFDYIYGSVHYINGWGFDNPQFLTEWDRHDIDTVYAAYYRNVVEMAQTGMYDIVAHIDLVKKFKHIPTRSFDKEIEEAVAAVAAAGMLIEVNTSGLRKPAREIYPSERILSVARRHGVPIVLGSDAHEPNDVAGDFDRAKALLRKAGYTKTAVIEKREIIGWEEI
jgi:histidinol-phosphatase (PHP family)